MLNQLISTRNLVWKSRLSQCYKVWSQDDNNSDARFEVACGITASLGRLWQQCFTVLDYSKVDQQISCRARWERDTVKICCPKIKITSICSIMTHNFNLIHRCCCNLCVYTKLRHQLWQLVYISSLISN